MKVRNIIVLIFGLWIIASIIVAFMAPAEAQEVTVGVLGDKPVNLITIGESSQKITVGTIGDDPVNIVSRTDGRLVARIRFETDLYESKPGPIKKEVLESTTAPERER